MAPARKGHRNKKTDRTRITLVITKCLEIKSGGAHMKEGNSILEIGEMGFPYLNSGRMRELGMYFFFLLCPPTSCRIMWWTCFSLAGTLQKEKKKCIMRWTCFSLAGSLQRKKCITCLDAVKITGTYEKNQVKKGTQNGILNNLECATEKKIGLILKIVEKWRIPTLAMHLAPGKMNQANDSV